MAHFHFKAASTVLLAWAGATRPEHWRRFAGLTLANLVVGCLVSAFTYPPYFETAVRRLTLVSPVDSLYKYLTFGRYIDSLQQARPQQLAPRVINPEARAFIGNASVDIFPHFIDMIPANQFRWNPRPVFQSYSAYTPYLDGWNAAHYRGPARPGKILLHWDAIDDRHPFFDDPLTWREILARYRRQMDSNQGIILGAVQDAAPLTEEAGDIVITTWGQWIDVPKRSGDELIAASVATAPSFLGLLWVQALRGTSVLIEVEHADGALSQFRTVRANLISGPVVSPLPTSLNDAKPILSGNWKAGRSVARIRFVSPRPSHFSSEIGVQWLRLRR